MSTRRRVAPQHSRTARSTGIAPDSINQISYASGQNDFTVYTVYNSRTYVHVHRIILCNIAVFQAINKCKIALYLLILSTHEAFTYVHPEKQKRKKKDWLELTLTSCQAVDGSEREVFISHVDSPGKLVSLSLVVDLLNGNVPLLAPRHGDARVQVVQLGRSQGNLLVLLLQESTETKDVCYRQ